MPRRSILTDRQRAALFDLPTDDASMLRHYTLADDDLEIIHARRRRRNRFGFALQLCALRYPGRLLAPGEVIPLAVTRFLAAQLGMRPDDLAGYAAREETRHEHLAALREIYGYKMFAGRGARDLKAWLEEAAETSRSNEDLARRFVEQCLETQIILPGITVVERLCADALVAAERRVDARIASRLDDDMRTRLDALLTEDAGGAVTRFVWLRQFEIGRNSADMNRLLDRLEYLQALELTGAFLPMFHRIALPDCAGRESDTSRAICGISRVTAASPFLRSACWNGAVPLPTPWSRPMTASSARPGARRNRDVTPGWTMPNRR